MVILGVFPGTPDKTAALCGWYPQGVFLDNKAEYTADFANVLKVGLVFALIAGFHEFPVEIKGTAREEEETALVGRAVEKEQYDSLI